MSVTIDSSLKTQNDKGISELQNLLRQLDIVIQPSPSKLKYPENAVYFSTPYGSTKTNENLLRFEQNVSSQKTDYLTLLKK